MRYQFFLFLVYGSGGGVVGWGYVALGLGNIADVFCEGVFPCGLDKCVWNTDRFDSKDDWARES